MPAVHHMENATARHRMSFTSPPMPTRRRSDEYDDLPAVGLRQDEFDERLRKSMRLTDEEREMLNRGALREPRQIRAIENYSKDPADWLAESCMTQTEVALRLGRALIVSGTAQSKVVVTLAGNELTHREKPQFPVDRFLTEWLGFTRVRMRRESWEGAYRMNDQKRSLVLLDRDRFEGHIATRLSRQRRLIAFVSRGVTASTRSSGEHKWVRGVIARAATWDAGPRDILAVCVPRSVQFSKVVRAFREREGIKRLRLRLLTIDRQTGDVGGLDDVARED
jgi:hypothetical protein